MARKGKLDPLEKSIEAHSSEYVPIPGDKRKEVEALLARARKTRSINIRISEDDLAGLKARAAQEGMPYQTLVSSVLHRYVGDRLVDEGSLRRSLQLLGKR